MVSAATPCLHFQENISASLRPESRNPHRREAKAVLHPVDRQLNNYIIQSEAAGIEGTTYLCRGANEPFAIRDGRLITGQ